LLFFCTGSSGFLWGIRTESLPRTLVEMSAVLVTFVRSGVRVGSGVVRRRKDGETRKRERHGGEEEGMGKEGKGW
jgi:hypothetical protein